MSIEQPITFFDWLWTVESTCVSVRRASRPPKVSFFPPADINALHFSCSTERWLSDPRATELERQIQSAVAKYKQPDSSLSGEDDSEPFPTSDDHPLASYSASASDQGPDLFGEGNRFDAFSRDDQEKRFSKHVRRPSKPSNDGGDEDDDDEDTDE